MRKLVKLPGPAPHTTRSTAPAETFASASTAATAGISASCSRPRIATARSATTRVPSITAALPA
jgi:hypothetical protein